MTVKDFQKKYHEYSVKTIGEAKKEIEGLEVVKDGDRIVKIEAVHFPGQGYGLMIDTAAKAIRDMGIV